jgi:dihydroorotase
MDYDLLIKHAHLLDPGANLDGVFDVAVAGDRIAAIEADIAPDRARQVLDARGDSRYVVPGLIDVHTHVAYGATTPGVGLDCSDPDTVGVYSGVTTVVDTGSVGVTNVGVFDAYIRPRATTRVLVYVNAGKFALTTARPADVMSLDEVDAAAIDQAVHSNPGLIDGLKLRITGPFVLERGEDVIRMSADIAHTHRLPFMAHVGNRVASVDRGLALTRSLFDVLEPGDIITHTCTPHAGGVMDLARQPLPQLKELQAHGVVLDAALGRGNFSYDNARIQADAGIHPDTISSDMTPQGYGDIVYSLMECMAKFLAIGYSLADVVRMTTSAAAKAIGRSDTLGTLAVGRVADITIFDVVEGRWHFTDTTRTAFSGDQAIVPVQTVRAGELIAPNWGPHPWGWLPWDTPVPAAPDAAPHR